MSLGAVAQQPKPVSPQREKAMQVMMSVGFSRDEAYRMTCDPPPPPVPTVAPEAFDFSHYQPGDVIVISMDEIMRRGQTESTLLIASIANAATRAGLDWKTERSVDGQELRISFSEPTERTDD
jgi:hypothetical protein